MRHRLLRILLLTSVIAFLVVRPGTIAFAQSFTADSDKPGSVHSMGPIVVQPLKPMGQQEVVPATEAPRAQAKINRPLTEKSLVADSSAAAMQTAETVPDAPEPPPAVEAGYVINFNNVGIIEFIRFISKITGKNFVFQESDLEFTVTVVSEGMTSQQDVMAALMQVLQIHGLSLLEQGNNTIIYKNANISRFSTLVVGSGHETSPIVTRVFRLNYMNPEKVRGIVQPLLSGQAIIEVSPETHHLIITDITVTIDKVAELLKVLDQPHNVIQIATYQTIYHTPVMLIELAQRILEPIAASEASTLTLVPQLETDKIFIISTPDLINRTLATLALLDIEATRVPAIPKEKIVEKQEFFVYKLQFFKGDKLELALRQVGISLASSGIPDSDLLSAINSMQWIAANNSLLFSGTTSTIEKLRELLKALDVAPRQVLIEMLVVQTTLANSLNFNIEWGAQPTYTNNGATTKFAGGFFEVPGITSTNATTTSTGDFSPNFTVPSTLGSTAPAQVPLNPGFNLGVIGNILRHNGNIYGTLGALLNALQTESYTQVIMNPKLVTTDTNTASVFVGQNTPFTTSSTQISGAASSTGFTVDYRDVGVYLEITPIIGSGDIVTLDIHQEINDVLQNNTINSSSTNSSSTSNFPIPTTTRTVTTTRVHLPSEYFLIISGMIKDSKVRTKNQFPCLGGLPLIGSAFTSQSTGNAKNNVIIFIHPHIIDTAEDIGAITDEQGCEYSEKSDKSDLPSVWGPSR